MIATLHHRGGHYLLLLAIGGLAYFLNLGAPTLWDIDEGRNLTCAMEMAEADNWIIPTFNGQLRTDKPVLLYWLQIFSFHAFGVNEFAGRFPSALAALLTVLLTYELTRSMFTRTTGLLAGVILATAPMQCGAAHFANPDALLNCFTVLTLTIFWLGLNQRHWWWFPLLGISSGLAVLAKGPVGLVLPGAVCVLFLLWLRQTSILWDRRWFAAFWSFVLTALPWYVWVAIETKGEFLAGFFWKHHFERATLVMGEHNGFPGFYLVVLWLGVMPWSIFLFLAVWFGFWSAFRCPWLMFQNWWAQASEVGGAEGDGQATDKPAAYRFLGCWILIYVACFSIAATKLPNYILPAIVPSAILIARFLQRWQTGSLSLPGWLTTSGPVSLFLFGVTFTVVLAAAGGVGELPIMGQNYLPGLEAWAPLGLVPMLAAVVGWWFIRQRQPARFVLALAVSAVVIVGPAAAFGLSCLNRFKVPRPLVEQTGLLRRDEDIRIALWRIEYLPSLNFYAQRNVEFLFQDEEAARFLAYRLPAYLVITAEDWKDVEPLVHVSARVVGRHYDMYGHREVLIVTNR